METNIEQKRNVLYAERTISPVFNRPSWQKWFTTQAEIVAHRSTCVKHQTGAVLVREGRYVIASGYNGVVEGAEHCCDYWWNVYQTKYKDKYLTFEDFLQSLEDFRLPHHEWATINELHGEQNCILVAAREGISTEGTEMYTVYSPCINCAKVIKMAGIKKVYYCKLYQKDQRGLEFLKNCNIPCECVPSSKILIRDFE